LPTKVNQEIASIGTEFTFGDIGIDLSLLSVPTVRENINFKLNTTFFGVDKSGARFYPTPRSVPLFKTMNTLPNGLQA